MRPETCSALLMDRELGELPSETSELLDAYLALDATAAAQAAECSEVVVLARRAVAVPLEVPRWEPFVSALRRAQSVLQLRRRAWASMRLAAGITLGIGIGWWWFAQPTTPYPTPSLVRDAAAVTTAKQHFWSRDNFVSDTGERPVPVRRVAWKSPVRKPQLKENP